jgi:hypothetical protein
LADQVPEDSAPPGQRYDVRAELIRWLCIDSAAAKLVDPLGLQVQAARVVGQLDVSFATVPFPLLFRNSRFPKDIDLSDSQLVALSLAGSGTRGIDARGMSVRNDLYRGSGFSAEGEVSFVGANLSGDLDARDGHFKNLGKSALSADRVKAASVFLGDGFSAEGEVRLTGANLSGDLEAINGYFKNPGKTALNTDGLKAAGWFNLNSSMIDGEVDLRGSDVKSAFFLQNLNSKNGAPTLVLDLSHSTVRLLFDDQRSWPAQGNLNLDGFVYTRLRGGPADAINRLRWLKLQQQRDTHATTFTPQPYEQLARILREVGDDSGAKSVLMAMENARFSYGKLGVAGSVELD